MSKLLQRLRHWATRLKRDGVALWLAVRDPRTPWLAKLICGLVVAYALSPIDLIPDFIPLLGWLDELLLLPGLIWLAIHAMPPPLMAEFRQLADAWLQSGQAKPKSMLGAILVLLIWLAALMLAGWAWWAWRHHA